MLSLKSLVFSPRDNELRKGKGRYALSGQRKTLLRLVLQGTNRALPERIVLGHI